MRILTKKFGEETAEDVVKIKRYKSRASMLRHLRHITRKSTYIKRGKEASDSEKRFLIGYMDRICELIDAKRSNYKFYWEK